MFWMIAVGTGCVTMALYILLAGDRLYCAQSARKSFPWRKVTELLKDAATAFLQAIAFLAKLLGKILYFLYAVLRSLVGALGKASRALAHTLIRWHIPRPMRASCRGQDKSAKRNERFQTDEEMQRIGKEIQRQGVVKYIDKQ